MSRLLEILGRAIALDTTDLIWHWLNTVKGEKSESESLQCRQLDKIVELMGNMKTDTAAEQLKLYLFEYPSCIRGRLAAAALCICKNLLQNAIEELNSVYMRQPSNTMALYALGHCYERLGKEAEAIEFYQDCLKFKNYLQLPRQRLAAIYLKNGQLEKTILEYELLKNEYPDDVPTLVALGYLYITAGQYAKTIETFNNAILMYPDNFQTVDNQINQLVADGQLHEALEQIENVLEKQPDRADLIVKHADILGVLGAATEAVEQYEEAVRICPDFLEANIKLGTHYLQMHAEKSAARQFNQSVEINDRIVDAYIGLTMAHKLAGDTAEALAALSLATAIDANSALLFAETASLQFKTALEHNIEDAGNIIEAVISAHRQQISICQQNPDLHYRLGMLMMSVGRTSEALKLFQRALEINPTYTRARNKLAICLFETGNNKSALEKLIWPNHLDKNAIDLHYKTALLYCDKIKFASSLLELRRTMENNFANPDATVNISIILQNLGLLDRAAVMWNNLSDTADHAINTNNPFSGQL